MNPIVESGRIRSGIFGSSEKHGFNGMFLLTVCGERIKVIASDGMGWQHVSVSKEDNRNRVPNYAIMCEVKNLFWGDEVWVVQYHPAKSEYVNNHPGCLHLWRPTDEKLPTPPSILTGMKEKSPEEVDATTPEDRLLIYARANLKP